MSARWAAGLRRKGLVASLVALALAMSLSGVARAAVKAAPGPSIATRTVKAVLIYPWAGCVTSSAWTTLAQDSSLYGTTQLRIDGTTFCSTSNQVTYAALVATKAKVLVFSDTAGGEYQLTPAEIAAITQYVQAGHNIVATYATFLYSSYDNSALAPLFGLAASFSATPAFVTPYYKILRSSAPLFSAVPNPTTRTATRPRNRLPRATGIRPRWPGRSMGRSRRAGAPRSRCSMTLLITTRLSISRICPSTRPTPPMTSSCTTR